MTPIGVLNKASRRELITKHMQALPYSELVSIAQQSSQAEQAQGKLLVGNVAAAENVDNYKVLGVVALCMRTIEMKCFERIMRTRQIAYNKSRAQAAMESAIAASNASKADPTPQVPAAFVQAVANPDEPEYDG